MRAAPAAASPAPVSNIPTTASRREPKRSASGPLTMPKPKYRKPASENTSEIWPRDAAKSRCSDSTNALNVYALPNPTNVTANAAATTYQP